MQLYCFVMQINDAVPSEEQKKIFLERMQQLAAKYGDKQYINFNDIVMSVSVCTC